ncbi:MAG: hypothetical protein NTV09_05950, partial [Bacteroidetes bacterium]|nr:hypothetical protein [Bacteroidota bacterium]
MRNIFFTLFFIYSTAAFTQQWQDVGGGIDLWVNVMKVDTVSDLLYVGGDFSSAGGISANSIAKWDGTTWQIIGNNEKFSGVGSINDIAFFNGDLIVAGLFDSVGNTKVNNIARFDGTQWQPISYGFDDEVYALEVFNGELYAGGTFFHSGLDTTPHIAKWNGNVWQPVGDGLFGGYVFSLKAFNNKLCVGGQGFYSLSQSLPCVAIWDNITWQPLGNGFNNYVGKLNVFQNELYAVGDFTPWAMNPSTRISRWDGNAWQSMPFPTGGTDQRITDLCEYNNKMYVCGFFNNPPDLARYNGIDYDSLCDVTGFINNLAVYKNELYVGGLFNAIN